MSTFKKHLSITERPGTSIDIVTTGERVGIIVTDGGNAKMIKLDPADDASIALAVMEAAQQEQQDSDPASADYARHEAMNWLMTARDRAKKEAAAAAEEAVRWKRRDELAREVTGEPIANFIEGWVTDLIDRIIDTEQELAKERAK